MSGERAGGAAAVEVLTIEVPANDGSPAERMATHLARVEFFTLDKMREMFGKGLDDLRFALALHKAREMVRQTHGAEFMSNPRSPGLYTLATEEQKLARGQRFYQTARKKVRRALKIVDAVDVMQLPSDQRDRVQTTKDRMGRALLRDRQVEALRVETPATCEVPSVPRNDRRQGHG